MHVAQCHCLVNDARDKVRSQGINRMQGAQIGDAVSAAKDRLPVADDKDRGARSIAGFQRSENGIDLGGGNLSGGARDA